MADINKRKRANIHTDEEVGTSVGAFAGDTMATALDPFGTAAGAIAGGTSDNKASENTVDDYNHDSKTRD
ncbi:hypothetical protein SAMN05518871_101619 [Psychrobacillus sp. OK028]|uniref:hypothetical protein n=1 Tax=Psychrobacillus sp. OK028 TaxID=1884359 RepID=UPI00087EEAC8|nr:hypothetical protein [Psychrobacillus sp. OK028]SDM59276.1 hypothetical protein SAMN05518871_101619 [Psychrobacillus sp. OK028]